DVVGSSRAAVMKNARRDQCPQSRESDEPAGGRHGAVGRDSSETRDDDAEHDILSGGGARVGQREARDEQPYAEDEVNPAKGPHFDPPDARHCITFARADSGLAASRDSGERDRLGNDGRWTKWI